MSPEARSRMVTPAYWPALAAQCGQAIDWEEDGSECRPAPGLETASKERYVLDPTRDQAAAKAMRTYAIVTEDDELYLRIMEYLGPMPEPETEYPFGLSERNLQELFETAWTMNTSDATRTELSQLVVDRISPVQQDFSCLTEFWKLFSGYRDPEDHDRPQTAAGENSAQRK